MINFISQVMTFTVVAAVALTALITTDVTATPEVQANQNYAAMAQFN